MTRIRRLVLLFVAAACVVGASSPQPRPVQGLIAGLAERLRTTLNDSELVRLDAPRLISLLTDDERRAFSTEYSSLRVNVPVTVSVMVDVQQPVKPFWLADAGFQPTELEIGAGTRRFKAWQKPVDAGPVHLGVQSFDDIGQHYFVVLVPQRAGDTLVVSDLYPSRHTVTACRPGATIYSDIRSSVLDEVPDELRGGTLVRTIALRSKITRLVGRFRLTRHPASAEPDQVVLTWSEDPRTTQTVQWRTSTAVSDGAAQYREADTIASAKWSSVLVRQTTLEDRYLLNDAVNHRYSGVMRGLKSGTRYAYRVGSRAQGRWSEPAEFTTAPDSAVSLSFIYMGDAQHGFDAWGQLLGRAFEREPSAAFCLMAGDLVNRGTERDEWDDFFGGAQRVFTRRPLVPVLGNHEYQGTNGPWMYVRLFTLPENGSVFIPPEQAYSFTYGNALMVALDSNQPPEFQSEWLEQLLATTRATWKFVAFHHPPYVSKANRDTREIRQVWGEVFDRYHVDLVLSGHDHAYLRTYPMRGETRVASPAEGTIYLISNSGAKYYEQIQTDYAEVGMTRLSLYQVFTIDGGGKRLTCRAYDMDGIVKDEFVIQK